VLTVLRISLFISVYLENTQPEKRKIKQKHKELTTDISGNTKQHFSDTNISKMKYFL
jgi:hypothetical protein